VPAQPSVVQGLWRQVTHRLSVVDAGPARDHSERAR
jgi:hypothetical protein